MIRATDMILASQRNVYDNLPRFGYTPSMLHVVDAYCALRDAEACRSVVYNNAMTEDSRRVNACTVTREVAKLREGRKIGTFHPRFIGGDSPIMGHIYKALARYVASLK